MTHPNSHEGLSTAAGGSSTAGAVSLIDCRGDYPIDKELSSVDDLPSGWYIVNFRDNTWVLYRDRAEVSENILTVGSYPDERVLWLDDKNAITE